MNRYAGKVGLSYWVSPRARLGIYYELQVNDEPEQTVGSSTFSGYDELEHRFSADALFRFP